MPAILSGPDWVASSRVADRVTPARRNVELKARDADPAATLERALALGASDEGVLTQRDTYFAPRAGG